MAPSTRIAAKAGAGGIAAAVLIAAPLVMKWEGLRLDPYTDIAGVRTVCYGETHKVEERYHSPAECRAKLRASLEKHASPVIDCLPASAPVEVQAAFVSFGYNVGVTAACSSSAAKWARVGDYRRACDNLLSWNKVRKGGKLVFSQGLANRRAEERALCLQGLA